MKLIIKMPSDAIKTGLIENDVITYFECCTPKLFKTLKSAVVLPEHHGRLVDADVLIDEMPTDICDGYEAIDVIERMPTIIEGE